MSTLAGSDRVCFALLRLWASNVRDRVGPHSSVSDAQSQLAAALCSLLDVHSTLLAQNARASTEESILQIVGSLIAAGVTAPRLELCPQTSAS